VAGGAGGPSKTPHPQHHKNKKHQKKNYPQPTNHKPTILCGPRLTVCRWVRGGLVSGGLCTEHHKKKPNPNHINIHTGHHQTNLHNLITPTPTKTTKQTPPTPTHPPTHPKNHPPPPTKKHHFVGGVQPPPTPHPTVFFCLLHLLPSWECGRGVSLFFQMPRPRPCCFSCGASVAAPRSWMSLRSVFVPQVNCFLLVATGGRGGVSFPLPSRIPFVSKRDLNALFKICFLFSVFYQNFSTFLAGGVAGCADRTFSQNPSLFLIHIFSTCCLVIF